MLKICYDGSVFEVGTLGDLLIYKVYLLSSSDLYLYQRPLHSQMQELLGVTYGAVTLLRDVCVARKWSDGDF